MDSDFNISQSKDLFEEEMIEIGSSNRFIYYKTRRNGVLHFVKAISPAYIHDLITEQAFKKEFILGYGLNHPGLVRYYAYEDNKLYEEYIEGDTLRELIEKQDPRLENKEFLRDICVQILETLGYLHNSGIVHLDLKPENIMISSTGQQVKIIDLSSAKSAEYDCTPGFTEGYMAPEQMTGKVDVTTDLYQLGKIMEELALTAGKSGVWKKFVSKATANHPDNRFRSASEALTAITLRKQFPYKWINTFILILIFGGLISIVIKKPLNKEEKNTTVIIEAPIEESDTSIKNSEDVIPKKTSVSQLQETREADIERMLTEKIYEKLDNLYSEDVYPMYERMMEDTVYKNSMNHIFYEKYSLAFDKLQLYGEELANNYPKYKNFIEEKVIKSFEVKTGLMMQKLYPRVKTPDFIEEKSYITISNDSI